MSWIQAVKEFAKTKGDGKFAIPRRDTPEYEQVKAIQARMTPAKEEPKKEEKKIRKIQKKVEEIPPQVEAEVKTKRVAKKKADVVEVAEVEVAKVEKVKQKRVAKKKEAPEVVAPVVPEKKGIQLINHASVVKFE